MPEPAGDVPMLAFVTAAVHQARLDVPDERLPALAVAAAPVHEALRRLADVDLGEAPPASTFDPSWSSDSSGGPGPSWSPEPSGPSGPDRD